MIEAIIELLLELFGEIIVELIGFVISKISVAFCDKYNLDKKFSTWIRVTFFTIMFGGLISLLIFALTKERKMYPTVLLSYFLVYVIFMVCRWMDKTFNGGRGKLFYRCLRSFINYALAVCLIIVSFVYNRDAEGTINMSAWVVFGCSTAGVIFLIIGDVISAQKWTYKKKKEMEV